MNTSVKVTETAAAAPGYQPRTIPQDVRGRLEGVSVATKLAFEKLERYMNEMDPKKPMDDDTAGRWQVQLFGVMMAIINRIPMEDFEAAFTVLLRTFALNQNTINDVFYEANVFRAMSHIQLTNEEDRQTFLYVTHLLKVSADPKGRAVALRQVDLKKALGSRSITEAGRQRVLNYLGY